MSASLKIKVIPHSNVNAILGWEDGILKVRICAVAEKGKANRELIRFLSKVLKIPQKNILLIKGEQSRLKTIQFEELNQEELLERVHLSLSTV